MPPDVLLDLWRELPPTTQDAAVLALLLAPALLIGALVVRGYRPWPLVAAMLRRHAWTSAVFTALIAVSVAIGVGLLAQERGLRAGAARAADRFDLIVAAPGSETTALLAAVYLEPAVMPLVSGALYAEIAAHPRVALAAPLAFGDSVAGAPIVGTTAAFVRHLSGAPAHGRMFANPFEAVAGAQAPVTVGLRFQPAHGVGRAAGPVHGQAYEVVGRIRPTGTPWDRAVMVPIESVWATHGLATGHAPGRDHIGPPFDAEYFPGAAAVVVRADPVRASFALRSAFTRDNAMAFFPGAVLARLLGLLGDVREAMSALALLAQGLVAASALTGLTLLARLFARRLALLRALGAPRRFVLAVVWSYAAALIGAGALAGLGMGALAAQGIARIVAARTELAVSAPLGWPEAHLAAGFVSLALALALVPALIALRRPVLSDLRG